MEIVDFVHQFLIHYGAAAVFVVGFLEELIFIIPSTLTFLAAGFFLIDPSLSWWAALLVMGKIAFWGSLGVTIGSFLTYGLFYWGGKIAINKYGKYLAISWEGINRLEQKFAKGKTDEVVFFLLRASPVWSMTLVSAFAGLIRWPWREFAVYTFVGTMVRLVILAFLGWKFGKAFHYVGEFLEKIGLYGTITLFVFFILVLIYVFQKQNKQV